MWFTTQRQQQQLKKKQPQLKKMLNFTFCKRCTCDKPSFWWIASPPVPLFFSNHPSSSLPRLAFLQCNAQVILLCVGGDKKYFLMFGRKTKEMNGRRGKSADALFPFINESFSCQLLPPRGIQQQQLLLVLLKKKMLLQKKYHQHRLCNINCNR